MIYDVLIVGRGPAGLSAAIYASRANLSVLVLGKDGGALEKAHKIENYFGLEKPVSGAELLGRGERQAKRLGAEVRDAEVHGIDYNGVFTVDTAEGQAQARSLIFALGSPRNKPQIPDIDRFEGRGVSYCAVCDAFFFRGKKVAVLGAGNYARHEAEFLKKTADSVTVLTNGEAAELDGYETVGYRISKLVGDDELTGVEFENGQVLRFDGLFVALGSAGALELANKLGVLCENGRIKTDDNGCTNLPGCFAAGDCIGGVMQVATAAAEGAKAALSAIKYLREI